MSGSPLPLGEPEPELEEDAPSPRPSPVPRSYRYALGRWLFEGPVVGESAHDVQYPWWKVMCLTGVDYFSTLGYQPGIAALAAGALAPVATLFLVLVTLLVAYPIYALVAAKSPHGQGSIEMLQRLLPRWRGKLVVLLLLGFAFTDFIITITLSAADSTAHIIENPFVPHAFDHPVAVTLVLLALLGLVFLRGFREAIGFAVLIVAAYMALNVVLIVVAIYEVWIHPGGAAPLEGRAARRPRQPLGDARGGPSPLPPPRARALGLRDRRIRDAPGPRRGGRRPGAAPGAHPQHAQAPVLGGPHHEHPAHGLEHHHDPARSRPRRSRREGKPTAAPSPTWPIPIWVPPSGPSTTSAPS